VEPAAETPAEPKPAPKRNRLFVRLGTASGLDAEGIKAALLELSGASAESIQKFEPRAENTFFEVAPEAIDTFLAANGKTYQDKTIAIEVARPPSSSGARRRRR
jgi:hypothetical protein